MPEKILAKVTTMWPYIEAAFVLLLLMFYTSKIKTMKQAILIWFIAVIVSSMAIPGLMEYYFKDGYSEYMLAFAIVVFDILFIPVLIRLFAKDLLSIVVESRIVNRMSDKGDK